ncbi:uncharacterized protein LOC112467570 [Temnothorax curvispinosus]|uniref:Uncharacterized protein LOC112467570 n=1 Tax=Temnothorax curvispinosus TaxID=300111 RepID=A0A6J1RCN9_9HYME|nr:uncharacterized protein LOC112467570 [Temnothorax curvispinosus]
MAPQRILQANLNHTTASQDVFLHIVAEQGCNLGVAAKPYRVSPNNALWAGSRCGSVAITWRQTRDPVPCSKFGVGNGYVVVKWGRVYVAGVYVSPNMDTASFERVLDELRICLMRIPPAHRQILVAGDFNAKSTLWGSPDATANARGGILELWMAGLGLVLLNSGNAQTCVRLRGGSIIDLTWASPSVARRVRD